MGLGINAFPAYVYIIFVYHVVYVDMSTRSSQLNHLNLESGIFVSVLFSFHLRSLRNLIVLHLRVSSHRFSVSIHNFPDP